MKSKTIVFVYNDTRQHRWQEFQEDRGPDEFMYGANHVQNPVWNVVFVERDFSKPSIWRHVCLPFERVLTYVTKTGFSLWVALDNLKQLRRASIIVSTADTVGLPIVLLKFVGIIQVPIIYISQGLSDRLERHPWLAFLYARLFRYVEKILVFGEGDIDPFCTIFATPRTKVVAIPFGVDRHFWTPKESGNKGYILSVGSDLGRDYPTLLKSIGQYPLHIITKQTIPARLLSPTVNISTEHTNVELRTLYQEAVAVVIPLQDISQPSGQSASLQAMACGKLVILTRTKGLWDTSLMQHNHNCYLVPPCDIKALAEALLFFTEHPAEAERIGVQARRSVEQYFTSQTLGKLLQGHIETLLDPSPN